MITIKSHFAFSGINIPSTINCSIISYFKNDQLIQQIDFPTTSFTEPLGQNYIIINNNLKTLDNNLTELQKYPNDHSSQLNITFKNNLDSGGKRNSMNSHKIRYINMFRTLLIT